MPGPPLLLAAYPYKVRFYKDIKRLDAGDVDIIEISMSLSGPTADWPVVEAASLKALALIPLVGLNTSREHMSLYAKNARDLAYFVFVLGGKDEHASLLS